MWYVSLVALLPMLFPQFVTRIRYLLQFCTFHLLAAWYVVARPQNICFPHIVIRFCYVLDVVSAHCEVFPSCICSYLICLYFWLHEKFWVSHFIWDVTQIFYFSVRCCLPMFPVHINSIYCVHLLVAWDVLALVQQHMFVLFPRAYGYVSQYVLYEMLFPLAAKYFIISLVRLLRCSLYLLTAREVSFPSFRGMFFKCCIPPCICFFLPIAPSFLFNSSRTFIRTTSFIFVFIF